MTRPVKKNAPSPAPAPPVYGRVLEILQAARSGIARTVNTTQVVANWLVGREIVEEEQAGKKRAGYGQALLADLSGHLTQALGKGWSVRQLEYCRNFYLAYPLLLEFQKSNAARSISDKASSRKGKAISNATRSKLNATLDALQAWGIWDNAAQPGQGEVMSDPKPTFTSKTRTLIATLFIAVPAINAWAIPTFDQVKTTHRPSDALLLDRHGEVLHRLRVDNSVRRGQWVALADVSPALRTALVASEDKRFYEHSGVDWAAATAAAWGNLWNTRTRGASTISMQLAGLLDEDLQRGAGGRSTAQKLSQTVAAQVLDRRWRKDEILEAYLNTVPFRGELVGIDAMSRTLFGKAAHGLDTREAAVAAALVRAPNAKAAVVTQRACGVLKLVQTGKADCEGLDVFVAAAFDARGFAASEGVAGHLAQRMLRERPSPQPSPAPEGEAFGIAGGRGSKAGELPPLPLAGEGRGEGLRTAAKPGQIRTTLSGPLQRFTTQTLQRHLRELKGRNVEDGAVVVLDNATGQVLAWVGSSGELSQAADVDGVTALRQPGSTLKPFLYAQAIAEQRLTAASLLEDSPTQINTASGLYIPQNYDRQFKGWVSVRTALASSLNVPAVRALVMVSPDAFARQLRGLGLPLKEGGDFYGYSLALGSAEVSLVTLTNAYRALGNGGRFSQVVLTLPPPQPSPSGGGSQAVNSLPSRGRAGVGASAPTTSKAALDPHAAFIISDILSDPNARARTFGTDSVLATRFWTAVKTGTSKDMRDNWAVGYSQRYTVGVWVGNASGAAMHDVSGTSGAGPIWAALMSHLHAREPSRAPVAPAGLVQAAARFDSTNPSAPATEAARTEWFIKGTEQTQFAIESIASSADSTRAGALKPLNFPDPAPTWIASPTNGTILALDPDIPPQRQRLSLQAQGNLSAALRWQIDGKDLLVGNAPARGPQAQWLPWPGRHKVQLLNGAGQVLDEVRIEVRGAGVKAAMTAPMAR